MDVDAIEPGLDFVKVLDEQVSGCDVLLALIGPNWVDAKNEKGVRRLDDPKDFVRMEIASALKRDIRVIPILIDGAPMPREEELPEPLQPLARRNAVQVSHVRFGADTQGLVDVLQRVTRPPVTVPILQRPPSPSVPPPVTVPILQRPPLPSVPPPVARVIYSVARVIHPVARVIVAGIFALASLPIVIATGSWFSGWLGPHKDEASADRTMAWGFILVAVLVAVTALAIIRSRRASQSGMEIALYWLGSALSLAFGMGWLFLLMDWNWYGPNPLFSGWSMGVILLIVTAIALAYWRRTALTGDEVAVYWLGSSVVGAFALGPLFVGWFGPGQVVSGWITGVLLAILSGGLLLLYWRRRARADRSPTAAT